MSEKSIWEKLQEEREEQRKKEVSGKITEKNRMLGDCQNKKNELNQEKTAIVNAINRWKEAKRVYNSYEIAKEVVKKDVFEGAAAETVKKKNEAKIKEIDKKVGKAEEILSWIDKQLTALDSRITLLSQEIVSLQSQL